MISIQGGYPDSFDAAIIANILHIMPEPEKALPEIKKGSKTGWLVLGFVALDTAL